MLKPAGVSVSSTQRAQMCKLDATEDSEMGQPPPTKGVQTGTKPTTASDSIREGLREDRPPAVRGVAETQWERLGKFPGFKKGWRLSSCGS